MTTATSGAKFSALFIIYYTGATKRLLRYYKINNIILFIKFISG